jgi:hypothetical protein
MADWRFLLKPIDAPFNRVELLVLSGRNGLDLNVVNADDGHIVTNCDGAVGIALGMSALGFRPAEGGLIENSREIETVGDGAAGVLMSGDGHQLINSGQIVNRRPPAKATLSLWDFLL